MNQTGSKPFFSVVMPVWNGEKYLIQSLDSLLEQTNHDWELIVIDDASTDRTGEILQSYATRFANIRILKNEQKSGIPKSLNRGIQVAKGEWIVRLDSDDIFTPRYLDTLHEHIVPLEDSRYFISAWITVINSEGVKVLDVRTPSAKVVSRMMRYENFIFHPATSFPKKAWERVGGYPEVPRAEDTGLWRLFLKNGISLKVIQQPLILYRIHDTNFTSVQDSLFHKYAEETQALLAQHHMWKISLFLKQDQLKAARQEIRLLNRVQGSFSLKTLFYFVLTFLPKRVVQSFMWEIRPRLRSLARLRIKNTGIVASS